MSDIKDFVIDNGVLRCYTGNDSDVVIPEGVRKIRPNAFSGCVSLTSVTIPDSMTEIGIEAFSGCTGLAKVTIPQSVTVIGRMAFFRCEQLKEVYTGELESWIAMDKSKWDDTPFLYGAVLYCNGEPVKEVIIPKGMTSIGTNMFRGCISLTSVSIPDSVTEIGEWAFLGCTGLTSVTIPESITIIGRAAFSRCTGLTSVTIPESITKIGSDAFSHCTSLTSVTIPESVRDIGVFAFKECEKLRRVEFLHFDPALFKGLDAVFSSCDKLSLVFPEGSFATKEKLSTDFCKIDICVSDREIAFLKLYQKGKTWDSWIRKKINQNGTDVFEHMLALFEDDKKASAPAFAEFMTDHLQGLSSRQVQRAMELLEKRKYKGLADLKETYGIAQYLQEEPIDENPIEARVRELCKASPVLPEALEAVKKGIPYAASKQLCSREAVAFILSEYVREWHRCAGEVLFPRYNTTAEGLTNGRMIELHPEADEIADELDRSSLSDVFEKLCDGIHYRPWLLAWARYANDASVNRMTSTYKTMIRAKRRTTTRQAACGKLCLSTTHLPPSSSSTGLMNWIDMPKCAACLPWRCATL